MAYTTLPANWSGVCASAVLLPDIDIIHGKEPVPVPSLDFISSQLKRGITLIPLVVGLGLTGTLAGSTRLGISIHSYVKLSNQLIDDIQALSSTIQDLQDEIDSLAEIVLQNRRELNLLTTDQGDICLALQERCCFYANKSGIVRDKIKNLQDDLIKRKKQL